MASQAAPKSNNQDNAPDRRLSIRINVQIDAELTGSRRQKLLVTLVNLSIAGCRIQTQQAVCVPGDITIMLEGLPPITAVAQWRDGDVIGCQFTEKLSVGQCNQIIRSLRERNSAA
mgnify:CR=1 FL=1